MRLEGWLPRIALGDEVDGDVICELKLGRAVLCRARLSKWG
jgi:hypothetical protein